MFSDGSTTTIGLIIICILYTVGYLLKIYYSKIPRLMIEIKLALIAGYFQIFLGGAILCSIEILLSEGETLLSLIGFGFLGLLIVNAIIKAPDLFDKTKTVAKPENCFYIHLTMAYQIPDNQKRN